MVDYYKVVVELEPGEFKPVPAFGRFLDVIDVSGVNISDILIGADSGELLPIPDILPLRQSFSRIRIKNSGSAKATVTLLVGLKEIEPLRQSVVLYKDLTGTKDIRVVDSTIALPVDIQYQSIDLTVVPKPGFVENSVTATGIDALTTVLDLDTRLYRYLYMKMRNTGANALDVYVRGYYLYGGTLYKTLTSAVPLAAGSDLILELSNCGYAEVKVVAQADVSGSPSDLLIEYIMKSI